MSDFVFEFVAGVICSDPKSSGFIVQLKQERDSDLMTSER